MKSKPFVAGIGLVLVIVAIGAALAFWKYTGIVAAANTPGFEPPESVATAVAESIEWQPRTRLVGTVFPIRQVTLANEIVGVVTELGFESGATVEPGQVLLRMDTSTEEADLAAAEAAERLAAAGIDVARAGIRMAEASLTLAQNNHRRMHAAAASQGASASELDRVNAELDRAAADLERERSTVLRAEAERDQAAARVRQIRTLIDKKILVAPFHARAGIRHIHPGQYLAEGAEIVDLTEITDTIYVDFAVPQEYASRVAPGFVVLATSEMFEGGQAAITVVAVDATVNATTRNVRVRSSIENAGQRLRPGMFLDVEVPVEPARAYTVIPATAVRRASFGDHVFILGPADPANDPPGSFRARQRMVELGASVGERVIVLSGLEPGELVAAGGSFKLREGALVMTAPPASQPASAPNETATN